jgi:hypothetical protein
LGRQLTAKLKEFSRVKGLPWENQAKASSQLTLDKSMYSYFDLSQNKPLRIAYPRGASKQEIPRFARNDKFETA